MKTYDFKKDEFSGMLQEEFKRMISALDNRVMPITCKEVTSLAMLQLYELVAMKTTAMAKHVQQGTMPLEIAQKGMEGEFKRGALIIYNLNTYDDGDERHTPKLDEIFSYLKKNILDLVEVTINVRLIDDEDE